MTIKRIGNLLALAVLLATAGASAQEGDDGAPGPDFVLTPIGWTHKSCGRTVPDGATVEADAAGDLVVSSNGRQVDKIAKCSVAPKFRGKFTKPKAAPSGGSVPTINGWLEYSEFTAPWNGGKNWLNRLDGQWTVPPVPTSNGGTIFFFNSIEDLPVTAIIQPVLQFGPSAAGGGNDWRIASWYVTSSGSFAVSTLRSVSAGDRITGNIVGSSCTTAGNCTWSITTRTATQTTTLNNTAGSVAYRWAQPAVLEVYNVSSCGNLPNSDLTIFENTFAYQPGALSTQNDQRNEMATAVGWGTWADTSTSPQCNYAVTNITRGSTLNY